MTAFSTIQAALLAALTAAPALAGGNISTNPTRPMPAAQSTAIVLRMDRALASEVPIGSLQWDTSYVVECYARANTGSDPVLAVDALLGGVWARLGVLTDEQIGGTLTMQPAIDWQFDAADTPMVCAVVRVNVQHYTTTGAI